MMILFDVLLSIIVPFVTMDDIPHFSQSMVEICDNGVDDDGDGLIDLNDTLDCICDIAPSPLSLIPNPSFEDTICCPSQFNQMDCVDNWIQASDATPDFFHECDYTSSVYFDWNQTPPDGNGYVGFVSHKYSTDFYKEYLGTCLNDNLKKDTSYKLEFYVGFGKLTTVSQSISPFEVVMYGSSSCTNLPFTGGECPIGQSDWMVVGRVTVEGYDEWVFTSMSFTPTSDISAIVIGGNCSDPEFSPELNYYWMDNLILSKSTEFESIASFSPIENCGQVELHTDNVTSNHSYQWYHNGVAILGAMGTTHLIDTSMSGDYQFMVSTSDGCSISEPYYYEYDEPNHTSMLDTSICLGQSILIGSESFDSTGDYTVQLMTLEGCDSTVFLDLNVLSPTDTSFIDTVICNGEQLIIDDQIFNQAGIHTIDLMQESECDRVVVLDLKVSSGYIELNASQRTLILGDSVLLFIEQFDISNPTNIQWTGPMLSCQDCLSQYVTPLAEHSTYGVTLLDSYGCTHESSIRIEATQNYYVPNAFTPNGDGLNDYFTVYSDQTIETIETMLIYNRWGDLIFDASKFMPNNEPQGWDGQFNGQDQGSGVYVYMIQLQDRSGILIQLEGDVTLIR